MKTTYNGVDIDKMLAIGPLATLPNSLGGHLLEIEASPSWKQRDSQIILLNFLMSVGIEGDNATLDKRRGHAHLPQFALQREGGCIVVRITW